MSRLPTRKDSTSGPSLNPRTVSDSSHNSRDSVTKGGSLPSIRSLRSIFSGGGSKKAKPEPPKAAGVKKGANGGGSGPEDGEDLGGATTGIVKPGWKTGESFGLGRPSSLDSGPKRAIPIPSSSSTTSSPGPSPKPPSKSSFTMDTSPVIPSGLPRFVSSSPISRPVTSPQPTREARTFSPSPTSPTTKAGYRISSDFARMPHDPPLASLRSKQPSLLLRKGDRRRMSTDSGSNFGPSPPPTPSKTPASYPFPTIALPQSPSRDTFLPPGSGAPSRIQSPTALDSPTQADRPFSPSPPLTSIAHTTGLYVSSNLNPLSSSAPAERESPSLKDDMAFRRLSINSQPSPVLGGTSPVLGSGGEKRWSTGRKFSGSNSPSADASSSPARVTTPVPQRSPDPLAIATFDAIPEPSLLPSTPQQPNSNRGSRITAPSILDAPMTPDDARRYSKRTSAGQEVPSRANGTDDFETHSSGGVADYRFSRDRQMSVDTFNSTPSTTNNPNRASQRRSRSPSRHSGNTFGQNDAVEVNEEELSDPLPPTGELASGGGPDDVPLAHGSPSSLRRTRSALDSVRRLGSREVSGAGERKVSPGSPVYVLSEQDFAGLYRSASARLQSSTGASAGVAKKKGGDIFPTSKEKGSPLGAAWNAGDREGEERPNETSPQLNIKTTTISPITPSRDAPRQEMGSPLDDLIAGLGGRRASASSLGTRTLDSMEPVQTASYFGVGGGNEEEVESIMDEVDPELSPEISQRRRLSDSFPHPPNSEVPDPLPPSPTKPFLSISHADEGIDTRSMSVEQMEKEMARMEAELALTGRRSVVLDPPSPSIAGATVANSPTSFGDSSSPVSNYSPHLERTIRASYPNPTPPRSAMGERTVSQSSSNTDITPRTARRWSIVEVEMAYQRMKEMLGSTRSYTAPDQITLAGESEMGDDDVEHAFERALADAKAQSPADLSGSADNTPLPHDIERFTSEQYSPSPARRSINIAPRAVNGLTDRLVKPNRSPASSDSHDRRTGSSPATSPFHSSVSHKASSESLNLPLPVQIMPSALNTSAAKANRRHTYNAPVSRRDENVMDVFEAQEARARDVNRSSGGTMRRSNSTGISSSSSLAAPKLSRTKTADSLKSSASEAASDDGWATPMTSLSGRRSRNRLSASSGLRSGAGKQWASETGRSWETDPEDFLRAPSPVESASASIHSARSPRIRPLSVDSVRRHPHGSEAASTSSAKRGVKPLVSDSWYPNTPDRAGHRRGQATSPKVATREIESSAAENMAKIRSMDKLEIFFKFTSAKADLEKAEMERDALLDALHETRAVLDDVRKQRDMMESELRREKNNSKQLKKVLGSDSTTYLERIEELMRSRATWEKRAREARDSIDEEREEMDALRRVIDQGRDREDHLEEELARMGRLLTAATSTRRDNYARNSPGGSTRSRRTPTQSEVDAFSPQSPSRATTAASKLADAYRQRTPSNTSSASGMEIAGLGDVGSPLMGQKMAFGPKSSYGSVISPVKGRQQPISIQPRGSGVPKLGLGLPQATLSGIPRHNRHVSKDSEASGASANSSDYGEHLPPPVERGWDPNGSMRSNHTVPELREEDDRFLSDLSGPIE